MNISFIGFGNMAKAMAQGLLQQKEYKLRAAAPSLPIGINANGIKTFYDNLSVLPDADVIILAVKPALMENVFTQIHTKLPSNCLVISIASGISLPWFEKRSPGTAIVRAMPNIAAAISKAATPLIANKFVTDEQKNWAEQIFTNIGLMTWAQKESDIDVCTALSGSGPAYIFMFMDAMIKTATALGLAEDIAKSFTIQTFSGALSLASKSESNLAQLRQSVTSPAGTTAAAIEVFTQHGFDELIHAAMKAALDRAQILGTLQK